MYRAVLMGGSLALAACVPEVDVDKTRTPPETLTDTTTPAADCADPAYGDGVCHPHLDCGVPDIDCFRTFGTQEEAEAFFLAFEESEAGTRGVVPSTDPRWQSLRGLLDEGWDAYREVIPLGDLAPQAPALVLVDDPGPNAFVIADYDADLSAHLVLVTTGLLDLPTSEDALLALMVHEIEHVVGLHLISDTLERMRRFYRVDGVELIGAEQPDDPAVRTHGEAWMSFAREAGWITDPALGGLPVLTGAFYEGLVHLVVARIDADPDGCIPAVTPFAEVASEASSYIDWVAVALDVPAGTGIEVRIAEAQDALRACWPEAPNDFLTVFGAQYGLTADQLAGLLAPEALAVVEGQHFVDGLFAVQAQSREKMRAIEGAFEAETGTPWAGLRYFSFEEAADDVTVPVMAALGRRDDAIGDLLLATLPPEHQDQCLDRMAGGVPPYGDDLVDEHHATCWRVDHVQRFAAGGTGPVARVRTPMSAPMSAPTVHEPFLPRALRTPSRPVADAPLRPCRPLAPGLPVACDPRAPRMAGDASVR